MPTTGSDGPYLDDPKSEYLLYLLGDPTLEDVDISNKADLVDGLVPRSEIPKSSAAIGSTVADRLADGRLKFSPPIEPDDGVSYQKHIDDIVTAIGVLPNLQEKRLTANLGNATDIITNQQIPISGLDITGVKSGQHWRMSYMINASSSQAGGILIRFRAGTGLMAAANYQVEGFWEGMTTVAAPVNNNFSRQEYVCYPAAHPSGIGGNNLSGSFGGLATGPQWIHGFFDVYVVGAGVTNDTIGLEYAQRVVDATPTFVAAGTKCVALETTGIV